MKQNQSTKGQLLARRRGTLFSASLWLHDDHILSVRNMRFTEEYARYYYKDILAIQVRRAPRFSCPIALLCGVVVFGLLALIFSNRTPHYIGAFGAIALLVLVAYNAYLTLFQSCRCHLVTAVSTDQIPGLFRISATRRAVAQISERVLPAQQVLDAGEPELTSNPSPDSFATRIRPSLSPVVSAADQPVQSGIRKGQFAASLTIVGTLADALITLMQSRHLFTNALGWIGGANLLLILIGGIATVTLFRRSKQFRWLRNLALISALFVAGISYASAQINISWQMFQRKTGAGGLNAFNSAVTKMNIAGDFCLVLAGAALALRRRSDSSSEPQVAAPGGL